MKQIAAVTNAEATALQHMTKTKTKTLAAMLCALAAQLTLAQTANAQVAQFPRLSANACQPTTPSVTTWMRGLLGFANSSTTTSISASCVLPINGTSWTSATTIVKAARVYYNDNNGVTGSTVSCTAYVRAAEGNGFTLGTRYSCATAGGCTSTGANNTYIGSGYLEFKTTSSLANASELLVMCSIPPIQSGWSVSSLVSTMAALTVQ